MMLRYKQSRSQHEITSSIDRRASKNAIRLAKSPGSTDESNKKGSLPTLPTTPSPAITDKSLSTRLPMRRVSLATIDAVGNTSMLWESDEVSMGSVNSKSSLVKRNGVTLIGSPPKVLIPTNNKSENATEETNHPNLAGLVIPTLVSPPSSKRLPFDTMSIRTISTKGPESSSLSPIVKSSSIICAASALLLLKGQAEDDKLFNFSKSLDDAFNIVEDAINGGGLIDQIQQTQQDVVNDATNTINTMEDASMSSLSSSDMTYQVHARRCASVATNKKTSLKRAVVVKASKNKKFRKSSVNLTKPETLSGPPPSKTGYKRIPSRLLRNPKILQGGMRLAAKGDTKNVNSLHAFVRKELLEVFVLKKSRRVGLRCIHCAAIKNKDRKPESCQSSMSTFFPKSLQDLYRSVCTWQRIHAKTCTNIPDSVMQKYWHLKVSDPSRGKKQHWIDSAMGMGFRNINNSRSGIYCCTIIDNSSSDVDDNDDSDCSEGMDYESDMEEAML
ncbi:hypothetical protein IV203_016688 [Nitzschia inconspicua]|uniref:Uncharacterized protein n=1 Tax=Nitzschia inconspicua TaxID=303405 RepID=A0A9K3PHX2_9STRA|nr:hypothetical protein IV203_016688 [Nitzschia inconspicua]